MGKALNVILWLLVVSIYFLIFNLISFIDFQTITSTIDNGQSSGLDQKAAIGDRVEVTSFHDGFFWNVRTAHYQTHKDQMVYFFGFIPLPYIIDNFNLFWIHLIIGKIFLLILIGIIFSDERRYFE